MKTVIVKIILFMFSIIWGPLSVLIAIFRLLYGLTIEIAIEQSDKVFVWMCKQMIPTKKEK